MKKLLRGIAVFVMAFCITCIAGWGYGKYLDKKLAIIDINNNSIIQTADNIKDHGHIILDKSIQNGDIILLGSSELTSYVEQNPRRFFPNKMLNRNVNTIGHAHAQSLIDAIRIFSMKNRNPQLDKVAIIVSLQWFMGKELSIDGTAANFSELQFYDFMRSSTINENMKNYVAMRVNKLFGLKKEMVRPWLYSELYLNYPRLFMLSKPYFNLRYAFLSLKDKHDSYKALKKYKSVEKGCKTINWHEEEEKAIGQGMMACTNNDFYVYDDYYNKYLKPKMKWLKGRQKNVSLLTSNEHKDFSFLLEVCKICGVNPYLVIMSTNGFYYDYTEMNKTTRWKLYDKIEKEIKNRKFNFLDLRNNEYEPYFYCDVMHLGWKGWLYVDKKLAEYFR